jgi:acetyltransferase-like isoleucine patch superfamily enzyme
MIGHGVNLGNVTLNVAPSASLSVGDGSSINDYSRIVAIMNVTIGCNVMIAEFVSIRDNDHVFDRIDIPMKMQGLRGSPIVIEDDVWIGRGAVVLKGARIGGGSVIGAHAVVNRDIPPYSIAVGVPARIIGDRREWNRLATEELNV